MRRQHIDVIVCDVLAILFVGEKKNSLFENYFFFPYPCVNLSEEDKHSGEWKWIFLSVSWPSVSRVRFQLSLSASWDQFSNQFHFGSRVSRSRVFPLTFVPWLLCEGNFQLSLSCFSCLVVNNFEDGILMHFSYVRVCGSFEDQLVEILEEVLEDFLNARFQWKKRKPVKETWRSRKRITGRVLYTTTHFRLLLMKSINRKYLSWTIRNI